MNPTLVKQALEKIINPHVLVNLVSRRVRQLNTGGGRGRPLLAETGSLGVADIALQEIIEGKMDFDMPDLIPVTRPSGKNRQRPPHWAKV
jgi:DNA-directed RNA polymerase subunit omega